ncbi:histidine kinase 5-like [Chenopodium quinoa]|uniref:histidine kinase 5-like n=1 Tax=Chenopodium quinoa TaxID=63459 RepID=UPI000B772A08|nr:histidine kinase 5-like [Chenopodium quinoa]XP_021762111.1 histidine kinase 5-like [Chenopodium quinoa]
MEDQIIVDDHMDVEEALNPMWPDNVNEAGSQFNVDWPKEDQDMLKEVAVNAGGPQKIDLELLHDMIVDTDKGGSQLANLMKQWEYKQQNAARLLREELDRLSKQREEVELKRLEILEEHRFEEERVGADRYSVSVLEELYGSYKVVPKKKCDSPVESHKGLEIDAEYDTIVYWKQRAAILENLLKESRQREQILLEKLDESIKNMEQQSTPVEELSQMLKRADNFIQIILQNAPIVLGHMDKELRYRFIYNPYPSFKEEDIIGKTDTEIFTGAGVKESLDFKREILERGLPGKREITFETELFGSKTFLIYVEPVPNKAGETIGVNYIGMDITDQVRKREKMAKLRETIAVQIAMETELNKTIHITEETMRAKQMLATMSHEIRSPLSGVVSMAEVLATTRLDKEQRQLLDVMISSGDLVLQLINDILDLSKVESGVMRLEATKFRPREVVRHVLQTAAASLKKMLTLEGYIAEDVPIEVIGDVLRIRQILTNLVSNAIKFTHEGKVGIRLYIVPAPYSAEEDHHPVERLETYTATDEKGDSDHPYGDDPSEAHKTSDESGMPFKRGESQSKDEDRHPIIFPTTVWIRCDVYDTGIGIPEHALPTLFKKYMQASADHARKYGGTGLGLAICKQLVELMGGHMTVSSKEHCGSTFTFVLPYRVSPESDDQSDDPDELPDASTHHDATATNDHTDGFFQFQPRTLSSSMLSLSGESRGQNILQNNYGYSMMPDINPVSENLASLSPTHATPKELKTEQGSHESSSRNSGDNAAAEISGRNDQYVGDERNIGENLRSLDMEAGSSVIGGQVEKTLHDPQDEQRMMQNRDTSLQSTASSVPDVNRAEEKPKILLVEDNKINVVVTTSMMKRLGHSIDVVNNGIEAIRAVQNHTYDLVLMDVCMPVMDGLQATRIIRSYEESGSWDAAMEAGIDQPMHFQNSPLNFHDSSKRIPIIAMTANALSESADECFANGMDSFVSKPVTFQKLKECLQQYLP